MLIYGKKGGFTLAEVLITIGIIGIIANVTIPSLIQNANNMAYVVALKKDYSVLQQAFVKIRYENGETAAGAFGDTPMNATKMLDLFSETIKMWKKCTPPDKTCWYDTPIWYLDRALAVRTLNAGDFFFMNSQGMLPDGGIVDFHLANPGCTADWSYNASPTNPMSKTCGEIHLDVNGAKGPNQFGRDIYYFYILESGIYPAGNMYEVPSGMDPYTQCRPPLETKLGYACTGYLLQYGVMDY